MIKGLFADPCMIKHGDTYYLYPTTDGFPDWSGSVFHAFSSKDLTQWKDEGIILDVASGQVPWAVGYAWAPAVCERDGRFYFYFCAKREDGASCIGVAVADTPTGPFQAMEEPLITPQLLEELHIAVNQTIDPSVYQENGEVYLLFGNGTPAIVQLTTDLCHLRTDTLRTLEGAYDFREAIEVFWRGGLYHFSWSCEDTGSEDYHVNYGISESLFGPIRYQYPILQKCVEKDELGTGHHCILKEPGEDTYHIVYHRFATPTADYPVGKGYHRELCLSQVRFDDTGQIIPLYKERKTMKFEIKDQFYLDGKPFQIISGAIHYFRVVPQYWRDRLEKLKAMGCNTVETYIPWNMHEPKKGRFLFEGMLDVERFVRLAQELGLYVILRPSPYICAEWEFGGLPGWLLAEEGMKYRISYPPFLQHVKDYYQVLLPKLVPLQVDHGGPVILMQVENEYGYYANDKGYPEQIRDMMKELGVVVPLVTSDGPFRESLNAGKLEGALPTGNFGSKTKERFQVLKQYTDGGPLMCTEFWVGWFDHWGNGGHMRGNLEESVEDLDQMLALGHVNIYMFEGGTNFGFMNGSNYYDELTPDVTSYDYDAVLTEDGQITEKYLRYQEVIAKYREIPKVTFSTPIQRKAYGKLSVKERVSLFSVLEALSTPAESVDPISMERLGQNYGYILYHSSLNTEEKLERIRLWKANDRAHIFVEHCPVATLYDRELLEEKKLEIDIPKGAPIDILVENMGRVNFGPLLENQRKGIDQCVQINGHMHNNWNIYPLPLDNLEQLDFSKEYREGLPGFYRFELDVEEKADTFLDFAGWGKGCVFVNGFNIGRFWEIGPQKRLYIPAPLLQVGKNEIILFETEGKAADTIELREEPDLG